MMIALNCVPVDCADQNKCSSCANTNIENAKMAKHFEIPRLMEGLGDDAIEFIGSTDRSTPFKVYYSPRSIKYNKYKRHSKDRPYVYIERTPNEHNKFDC